MRLQKLTTPTALPIPLQSIRDHLRIDTDETAYDSELTDLIRTASEWVEANCHQQLISTQYLATWNEFPDENYIKLPLFPVVTVDELVYDDLNGDEQEITDYQTDLIQTPARIWTAPRSYWPDTEVERIGAVRLKFTAGYGANASTVPNTIKHLLKLLVGHWFKHKEAILTGTISKEIEIAANDLMLMNRVNEFEAFV